MVETKPVKCIWLLIYYEKHSINEYYILMIIKYNGVRMVYIIHEHIIHDSKYTQCYKYVH